MYVLHKRLVIMAASMLRVFYIRKSFSCKIVFFFFCRRRYTTSFQLEHSELAIRTAYNEYFLKNRCYYGIYRMKHCDFNANSTFVRLHITFKLFR